MMAMEPNEDDVVYLTERGREYLRLHPTVEVPIAEPVAGVDPFRVMKLSPGWAPRAVVAGGRVIGFTNPSVEEEEGER